MVTSLGLVLLLISIFSAAVGVDQDAGWGPARKFVLATGVLLIAAANLTDVLRYFGFAPQRFSSYLTSATGIQSFSPTETKLSSGVRPKNGDATTGPKDRTWVVIALVIILAGIAYAWLTTVGTWTYWPHTTRFYHLLADGFREGKTHLLVKPSEELLELEDPYDYESREKVEFLWDASLYEGKYYIYWGPAPALITMGLELFVPSEIGDQYLGWILSLLMLFMILLFVRFIWRRYSSGAPDWLFAFAAFVLAFANPLPWIMTRPAVYESAIASGQFFFWGGMLLLVHSRIEQKGLAWKGFISGCAWCLAVGSRATLALAVVVGTIATLAFDVYRNRDGKAPSKKAALNLGYLLMPLILGAGALAWYNVDRFGTIFEFGHRYQLTSIDMTKGYEGFFSTRNILPNAFNYLLNPFRAIKVFPFLKPEWGKYSVPFLRASTSSWYTSEKITGLLISSPILLAALLPLIVMLLRAWDQFSSLASLRNELRRTISVEFHQIYLVIFIIGIVQFVPLLPISFISMRYSADFAYAGFILAFMGICYGWAIASQYRRGKVMLIGSAIALGLYSVIVSGLLAMTGYYSAFEKLNPELFEMLTRFFTL